MAQTTLERRPYTNSELFSGYYLDERLRDREEWDCDEEVREAFDEIKRAYEGEKGYVDGYKEDQLCEHFIDPVLDALGYNRLSETKLPQGREEVDRLLFSSTDDRRDASILQNNNEHEAMYKRGVGLLEAKQWDFDFSKSFSTRRNYANASSQIRYYLEKTPVEWGVLTDGRKWRLYATRSYRTDIYYEVDLPELLEDGDLDAFKYFYLFFRPEAFVERAGSSFLDEVESESETAAKELGEDLQDNVFTALRVLGRGFVETNDLRIDPEDDEALDELKNQSLVLLYRLMFVLYAESRGLIHPDGEAAVKEYEENFSLDELRFEIHDEIGGTGEGFEAYSEHSTTMWRRLEDLFALIDEGEKDLGIPPYNGGLFDHDEHEFLTENAVSNRYVAEVVYRMSTTENDEGQYVLADYADLDTRHLGSVYEGLLEHQFEIAPEDYAAVAEDGGQVWKPATEVTVAQAVETVPEGGLYVVNDEGERKATGAYYTPDYVVSYIVEETVGPLVDEIREDLRSQGFEPGTQEYIGAFLRRTKGLKVLDPAMGSAHFLTSATGYLAEEVMSEVREVEEEVGADWDENLVRREIAKECIYGVDVNGMAVELGKLSMWLETLAADRPLAFLDHHLKQGNSLVGSEITEVLSNGADDADEGQLTLQQSFARLRERTLDHVMDLMRELLEVDNETLGDIKSMEELYDEIRSDALYQRLFELANVHTAEEFGVDVPKNAYEEMAGSIENPDDWAELRDEPWFREAQRKARAESFFHWELEFPGVFFDADGEKREDAGFDAVIGNPPYVRIYGDTLPEDYVEYLRSSYETAHMKFDLYVVFSHLGIELCRDGGRFSYIVPDKFISTPYGEPLREMILEGTKIHSILDLRDREVFTDVTVSNLIPVLQKTHEQADTLEIRSLDSANNTVSETLPKDAVVTGEDSSFRLSRSVGDMRLTEKVRNQSIRFDKIFYTNWGLRTGTDEKTEKYVVEETDNPKAHPMIRGNDIEDSYRLQPPSEYIIYEKPDLYNPMFEELFENDKIVFRKISGRGLMAVADENEYYCFSTLIPCVNIRNVSHVDRTGIPEETPESASYRDLYYPLAIVNSSLLEWFYGVNLSDELSVVPNHINELPVAEIEQINEESNTEKLATLRRRAEEYIEEGDLESKKNLLPECDEMLEQGDDRAIHDLLSDLAKWMTEYHQSHVKLNLDLLDYLGVSEDDDLDGETLGDLYMPPPGLADSTLSKTAEDLEGLRVEGVDFEEDGARLVMSVGISYKPDEDDPRETDRWGRLAEEEFETYKAMVFTGLSDAEETLVRNFVPVAVDEAGGFAGFRDSATKNNSLVDRLEALTLPDVDATRDGLERYIDKKERADELDEKIQKTDDLIDEIVYDLYGLTDEEIEIVEEAVEDS